MISKQALKEFITLYQQEFGIELDETTALEAAINLLTLFDHVYRSVSQEWLDEPK